MAILVSSEPLLGLSRFCLGLGTSSEGAMVDWRLRVRAWTAKGLRGLNWVNELTRGDWRPVQAAMHSSQLWKRLAFPAPPQPR